MLKFLGRGSAFNTKEGNTSAYIKKEDTMLLIDCGETVFSKLNELDLLYGVKNLYVVITHLHPDHVGSLGSLLFYCKYILEIEPVIIYPNEDISDLLKLQGIRDGYTLNLATLLSIQGLNIDRIDCYNTSHVEEIEAFSYRIKFNNGEYLFYTGDTNSPRILEYAKDNDCQAIYVDICLADYDENVHFSLRELCELMPNNSKRQKIHCMHLDSAELEEEAIVNNFKVVKVEK